MENIKNKSWIFVCGLVLAVTFVFAWNAQAIDEMPAPPAPPKPMLKITSFNPIGDIRVVNAGEVCGRVVGLEGKIVPLQITSDFKSNNPGHYLAHTLPDGRFCHVIMTYRGQVEVRFAMLEQKMPVDGTPPSEDIPEDATSFVRLNQFSKKE